MPLPRREDESRLRRGENEPETFPPRTMREGKEFTQLTSKASEGSLDGATSGDETEQPADHRDDEQDNSDIQKEIDRLGEAADEEQDDGDDGQDNK